MRIDNPDEDAAFREINRRLDNLEKTAGLGKSSVTEGQTQFIGDESLLVSGSGTVTGTWNVDGTQNTSGTQNVDGQFNQNGPYVGVGDESHAGNLNYTGPETHVGNESHTGATTNNGPTTNNGTLTQNGNETLNGDLTIGSGRIVFGAAVIDAAGGITSSTNLIFTAGTSVSVLSAFAVQLATLLHGDLTVSGQSLFSDDVQMSAELRVNGQSSLRGRVFLPGLNTTSLVPTNQLYVDPSSGELLVGS